LDIIDAQIGPTDSFYSEKPSDDSDYSMEFRFNNLLGEVADANRWQLDDFLDFGDGFSSASETERNAPEQSSPEQSSPEPASPKRIETILQEESRDVFSSPFQIVPFADPSEVSEQGYSTTNHTDLLMHLDRSGAVTSFQRNQHRHKQYLRRHHNGGHTENGIKHGRFAAANNPITPIRKQKQLQLQPPKRVRVVSPDPSIFAGLKRRISDSPIPSPPSYHQHKRRKTVY
jgi:hypothetical protein